MLSLFDYMYCLALVKISSINFTVELVFGGCKHCEKVEINVGELHVILVIAKFYFGEHIFMKRVHCEGLNFGSFTAFYFQKVNYNKANKNVFA